MKRTFALLLFWLLVMASASAQTISGTQTVPFSITKAQCSQIPADITGTITISFVAHSTTDASGVSHIGETDVVRGTATDTLGNHYVVIDNDVFNASFNRSGSDDLVITQTERFMLRGQGSAPTLRLAVTFHVRVTNGKISVVFNNVRPATADEGCFIEAP